MKSTVTTKTVEEKVITLEMTERQAEILYHFMGRTGLDTLIAIASEKVKLDKNMRNNDPDAINFCIYDALSEYFDPYYRKS